MTYSTLMAHLHLRLPNDALLRVTKGLAERFKVSVIGIAACQPMQIAYGDGYINGEVVEQDRAEIEQEMKQAEALFRAALHGSVASLEWRSAISFMSLAAVAEQARAADLPVTSAERREPWLDSSRHVDVGEFVMRAGRPVLVVPPDADQLDLANVVVGWKDGREARRAIADALPLLKQAGRVTVVEIAADEDTPAARDRLKDVVDWLARHDIAAEPFAMP